MIFVYQIDNRFGQDEVLDWASKSVEKAAKNYEVAYRRFNENRGDSIRSGEKSFYYSKLAVLEEMLVRGAIGDIIVYIDSDIVAEQDGIIELVRVINDNPEKSFFITSILAAFNGGIFAVKIKPEIKTILLKIIDQIKQGKYSETFDSKFGELFLPDEVPFDYAILNNEYNINRQIYYLDTEVFNCLPPDMFPPDEPDYLPKPSEETRFMHYTGEIGKDRLKQKYMEEQ